MSELENTLCSTHMASLQISQLPKPKGTSNKKFSS